MARKPELTTEQLIALIDEFYIIKCHRDAAQLKIPEISAYICQKGYNVQAYTLRRNDAVKKYIANLCSNNQEKHQKTVVVYKTLDLNEFFERHNTKEKMAAALFERDEYYKDVANAAAVSIKENKQLKEANRKLKQENAQLREELQKIVEELEQTKDKTKELQKEVKKLMNIIETYVYPEIANELLVKEKILKESAHIVDEKTVENKIIHANTDIRKIKNNVVKGLFDIS